MSGAFFTGFLAKVVPWIVAAVAVVAALLGYGARQKAKGRNQARQQARDADNAHANDIRNRVERDLPDRLRDFDDAGYRD